MGYKVQISKHNTREHHSLGDAYWDKENEWWNVELDRTAPPYRGQYLPDEVSILHELNYSNVIPNPLKESEQS